MQLHKLGFILKTVGELIPKWHTSCSEDTWLQWQTRASDLQQPEWSPPGKTRWRKSQKQKQQWRQNLPQTTKQLAFIINNPWGYRLGKKENLRKSAKILIFQKSSFKNKSAPGLWGELEDILNLGLIWKAVEFDHITWNYSNKRDVTGAIFPHHKTLVHFLYEATRDAKG